MFADVFGLEILKTNIDQDAASLGAAAIAVRGAGLWTGYGGIAGLHEVQARYLPRPEYAKVYAEMLPKFALISETLADLGDKLRG